MIKTCKTCGARYRTKRKSTKHCRKSCKPTSENQNVKSLSEKERHESKVPDFGALLHTSLLKAFKEEMFINHKRETRIKDLFLFTQAVLWPERNFSEDERESYLNQIEKHFKQSKDHNATFKQLIERTAFEKCWLEKGVIAATMLPSVWFNIDSTEGLANKVIYEKIEKVGELSPDYAKGLAVFSETVLKYYENRNLLDFYSCRDHLIALNQKRLLTMLTQVIAHIHFLNF